MYIDYISLVEEIFASSFLNNLFVTIFRLVCKRYFKLVFEVLIFWFLIPFDS